MAHTPEQQATYERFSKKYRLGQSDVMRRVERSVCGCDYGATSWTTVDEAREIGNMLALEPGKRLLDIGSGSGWPGILLAGETGCDVTLTDLHPVGLRVALDRAATDGVATNCSATVADGAALPFRNACFDAIHHADVLCCLADKTAVLETCRRIVGDDGNMVFSVIFITPGLAPTDHAHAIAGGPPFVDTETPYPEMLSQTGWRITEQRDMTACYRTSVGRQLDELEAAADEISALFGEVDAAGELTRQRATVAALDLGFLRRELFAVAPAQG